MAEMMTKEEAKALIGAIAGPGLMPNGVQALKAIRTVIALWDEVERLRKRCEELEQQQRQALAASHWRYCSGEGHSF